MSTELPDDLVGGLIRRAMVPKGFRPKTTEELDRALDALGHVDISEERVGEIVAKILKEEPPNFSERMDRIGQHDELTQSSDELVELFRAEGDISSEIEERLRELERQAELEAEDQDDEEAGHVE